MENQLVILTTQTVTHQIEFINFNILFITNILHESIIKNYNLIENSFILLIYQMLQATHLLYLQKNKIIKLSLLLLFLNFF